MGILDWENLEKECKIRLQDCYEKSRDSLSVCIINFSEKIMTALIDEGVVEIFDENTINSVSCAYPVYKVKGTDIGVVKTTVGAPITATLMEEISYVFSCKKFVLFGSSGGLTKTIEAGKLIVPTAAYRDEGMSYHYVAPSDFIEIKNHGVVSKILDGLNVDYEKGKSWTTDAFYRETTAKFEKVVALGCVAVEMELSACQAVADFWGLELYSFLYRADNLDSLEWEKSVLKDLSIDRRLAHFFVALEIAKKVSRKENL